MSKIKIVTAGAKLGQEYEKIRIFQSMGFELLTQYVETTREYGHVVKELVILTFSFNFNQKNAAELWKIYKQYAKKQAEISSLEIDKRDNGKCMDAGRQLAISGILALIIAVGYLLLFENPFDLLSRETDFIFFVFFALIIGSTIGILLGTVIEYIYAYCTRNKRLFHAIERIPVLEKELKELVQKANQLRM